MRLRAAMCQFTRADGRECAIGATGSMNCPQFSGKLGGQFFARIVALAEKRVAGPSEASLSPRMARSPAELRELSTQLLTQSVGLRRAAEFARKQGTDCRAAAQAARAHAETCRLYAEAALRRGLEQRARMRSEHADLVAVRLQELYHKNDMLGRCSTMPRNDAMS